MWSKPYKNILESYKKEWMDNPSTQLQHDLYQKVKREIIAFRQQHQIQGPLPLDEALTEVCHNLLILIIL